MIAAALPGMSALVTPSTPTPADTDAPIVLAFETLRLGCGCVVELPKGQPTNLRCGARLVDPCVLPRLRDAYALAVREIPRGWLLDTKNARPMRDALQTIAHHVDCGLRARR